VQGWLTLPKDYDRPRSIADRRRARRAGRGCRAALGLGIPERGGVFGTGILCAATQPAGSFGQGESLPRANREDLATAICGDILGRVDTVEAGYPVDSNRVGLTGWSYGGFMTMFAVTQTQRFKAAVAGAGISDWQSYYGENSIDQW